MTDRDSKVRLNLAANGFLTQLQQLQVSAKAFELAVAGVGDGADKSGRKLGAMGTAAKAGFGAAKSALAELGSGLKSTLTQVATLGGALSAANAARGAVELTKGYKDIANSIEAGTGRAMTWQAVQSSVEGTAGRWKRSNQEVSASYRKLWDDIGDSKFATAGIESAARAATAGHGSMTALTTIVGQLKEKFDIPTEGIDDALASVIALGNKGGANVEELGEKIGILGATAKEAGFGGQEGLQKMLGMLNSADNVTGNFRKSLKAVTSVFDTLGDPEKLKTIGKELKIGLVDKTTGKPFAHALEMILAKSGGKQEVLAKVFSGEELKLVTEFGKTYAKAFDETKGDIQTKMKAGLAAYNDALKAAGETTLKASEVDKQAKDRLGDTDRQIADALRKLEIAFTKPEMVEGLTKLAEVAPKVADALAKLLGFAVDHPKTAVAAVVGGKVLGSVVPAVGGSLLGTAGKAILKKVLGSGAAAAATEGAAATTGGSAAAEVAGGGAAAGLAIPAAIVGAGAALGYGAYKLNKQTDDLDKTYDAMGMPVTTDMASTGDEQRAAARLRASIAADRERNGSGLPGAFDWAPPGGGGAQPAQQKTAKTQKEIAEFEASLKKGSTAGDRTAQALGRLADVADRVAGVLNKYNGDGSNGLPPSPGNDSGSTPR